MGTTNCEKGPSLGERKRPTNLANLNLKIQPNFFVVVIIEKITVQYIYLVNQTSVFRHHP